MLDTPCGVLFGFISGNRYIRVREAPDASCGAGIAAQVNSREHAKKQMEAALLQREWGWLEKTHASDSCWLFFALFSAFDAKVPSTQNCLPGCQTEATSAFDCCSIDEKEIIEMTW